MRYEEKRAMAKNNFVTNLKDREQDLREKARIIDEADKAKKLKAHSDLIKTERARFSADLANYEAQFNKQGVAAKKAAVSIVVIFHHLIFVLFYPGCGARSRQQVAKI
jgi:hypothetical protein